MFYEIWPTEHIYTIIRNWSRTVLSLIEIMFVYIITIV